MYFVEKKGLWTGLGDLAGVPIPGILNSVGEFHPIFIWSGISKGKEISIATREDILMTKMNGQCS